MPTPTLSVIIPTRNEARTIEVFLRRTVAALANIPSEIVVVDDSEDRTPALLVALQRTLGVSLIVHHRPRGSVIERSLGTAVVEGIRRAQGEYICVMDADGQHPPEAIPTFLQRAHATGAEYVGGSRYLPGGSAIGLDGQTRLFISRGLALLTRCLFGFTPVRRLTDPLSGFFLFYRPILAEVDLAPISWKISLEILIRSRVSCLTEVPYVFAHREDDTSKATVRQGLLVLKHEIALLSSLVSGKRSARSEHLPPLLSSSSSARRR